ncbi:methionyl-tRNA formyltransferase [Porphyrobacter sp. GA68]|uniref:methionyl-tRNA formyltransferase n=1 Tax=Porphyrobacter sp. GA68 TaxID=2883480 RepID=UPI001D182790|nr:methionyl-tRNA formyltransferase [Porphyrobacter sp. GA68]
MRIIFMGTPDFAVPTLRALHHAAHEILAVYTQPPRPAGRGKKPQLSPVQCEAEALGLAVHSPASLRSPEEQERFAALGADVAVVAAYGLILPRPILDAPRYGCLNVHASLLPRWRGAAPVQRAILAGDPVTGITIMQMEEGLDTGPMLASARVLTQEKNAGELTNELAEVGAQLMVGTLRDLSVHRPVPQDEQEATYARKIAKAEARIDWTKPATNIERQVRAFAPAPGAWFMHQGERYRVLAASVVAMDGPPGTVLDDQLTVACGDAAVRVQRIGRAGRPAMAAADFLRGRRIAAGTVFE